MRLVRPGFARALVLVLGALLCSTPPLHAAKPRSPSPLWVPPSDQIPRDEPPPQGVPAAALPPTVPVLLAATQPQVPSEKKRRVRVTVIPPQASNIPDATVVSVQRSLSDSLRRNERLDMKDLDVRLSDFAQEVPLDQVDLARQTYQKGQEALDRHEHAAAIPQLEDAVDQLAQVLPYVKKQELADAQLALALAQLRAGNKRASANTLVKLMTWRPEYEPDPGQFPVDEIRAPLEAARQAVGRAEHGEIRIASDPPGAQAFVDGTFLGVTPMTATGLLVGEHYVTFKKLGFKKGLRIAQVASRTRNTVQARLARSEKFLLVKQAMDRLEKDLGGETLDPVVDNLKETLYLDHAVFLRLAPLRQSLDSGLLVTVDLYDLRTRARLAEKKLEIPPGVDVEGRVEALAGALYAGVDYEGAPHMSEDPQLPVVVAQKPLYKRWWFLTTIGVLAAGSAAAITAGVILSRPAGCPGGSSCTGPITF